MDVPLMGAGLGALFRALHALGGRTYIVGGAVRDLLLGLPIHDYDLEVFGLPKEKLKGALETQGRVDEVGQAFTVYKVSGLQGLFGSVDVALPRKDSKVGAGHRGIAVQGDPNLSVEEAARRRDFTINALLLDPLTGDLLDPFGGRDDLRERRLKAVDPKTFGEDPLRALRAVQLAARFELSVDPETAALCATMPLTELPPERIFGELEKLLLRAHRPSLGFALLRDWGLLHVVAPELVPLLTTEQDPEWHPEGDVFTHTLMAMDEGARLLGGLERPRALAVMLGVLCHDLGKPLTTRFEDGRVRSPGHEEAGLPPTKTLLDRWNVYTLEGYDLRGQILGLVGNHLKPAQLYKDREKVGDGAIRRLARRCEPGLLYRVARADCLGRKGDFPPVAMDWFMSRVESLDVAEHPPAPLLKGRDILALGVPPGPFVGTIIRAVYEKQLDGAVTSFEEARVEALRFIQDQRSERRPGRP